HGVVFDFCCEAAQVRLVWQARTSVRGASLSAGRGDANLPGARFAARSGPGSICGAVRLS
ncbi:hypothetical protein ACSTG3_23555, partial [Vibrio parahaemolyticus]